MEGVKSTFRIILESLIVVYIRTLSARTDSFFLVLLPDFYMSMKLPVLVYRFRKEEIVKRGILVLYQIVKGLWLLSLRVKMRSFSYSIR